MRDRQLALRAGARAMLPILVGIVPFGLVAGIAPVTADLGAGWAVAYSFAVFAGAAQLAMVDLLDQGAAIPIIVGTALVINLRMMLYGASLGPFLADGTLRQRLGMAYLITDQAYGVTIAEYGARGSPEVARSVRFAYYLGGAVTLWATWQISTILGVVAGEQIPDEVPLEFALPLVFLALLVPAVVDRPTILAALVGGAATVVYGEAGVGNLSLLLGMLSGVVAGTVAAWVAER